MNLPLMISLTDFMTARGLTDRAQALEDMLGSILPAIDLSKR